MQAATHRRGEAAIWPSLALALILHAVAVLVLFLVPPPERRMPAPDEGISVQILELRPLNSEATQPTPVEPYDVKAKQPVRAKVSPAQSVAAAAQPEVPATVQAKQLFSAAILADPRSRQALEGLSQLAYDERIVQLCNLEAMEQVHRWRSDFAPDFLVAYAMADTRLVGQRLRADGAAFRSNDRWYEIKFNCEAAPDIKSVVAFEFQVGDEIPESEWEAHFLSAGAKAH